MAGLYDVVVIGGTIAGLTSALQLRRKGMRVVVLDPNSGNESAVVGHGVASPMGALTGVAEERVPHNLGGYVAASGFVGWIAGRQAVDVQQTGLVRRTMYEDREPVDARLRASGAVLVGSFDQPLPGLTLRPGWRVEDALLVDPVTFVDALVAEAKAWGVEIVHNAAVTRFRRNYGLHTVHYRSQLTWERTMFSVVAARVIDTMGVSPWGSQIGGASQAAPLVVARGLAIDSVLVLPDAPAHVIRPWTDDQVIVTGHSVSPPALETARVGLAHWLSDALGLTVSLRAGFGVQPTPEQDARSGASAIPGTFWASGHGMWELTRGTASGLWLAERLLHDPESPQRLGWGSRLRAKATRHEG